MIILLLLLLLLLLKTMMFKVTMSRKHCRVT